MGTTKKQTAIVERHPVECGWFAILQWLLALGVIPRVWHRILLFGPPSTGKSTAPYKLFPGAMIEKVDCFPELAPESLLAGSKGLAGGETVDRPDSAARAFRDGHPLILDEFAELGPSCKGALHNLTDDRSIARITFGETGEIVHPHPDFSIWATTNESPEVIGEALLSRFDLVLHANRAPESAFDVIRKGRLPGLAEMVSNGAPTQLWFQQPLCVRSAVRLNALLDLVPVEQVEQATRLVFGSNAADIIASASVVGAVKA